MVEVAVASVAAVEDIRAAAAVVAVAAADVVVVGAAAAAGITPRRRYHELKRRGPEFGPRLFSFGQRRPMLSASGSAAVESGER